tara:strand:- start:8 stop:400 length:393 start_codon:yes stop_codon:yes gene_type:complete
MVSNFIRVMDFMNNFGQEVKYNPEFPDEKVQKLRISLIEEELEELKEAMGKEDMVGVADALTDILYVAYGAGASFGIDLDKCFEEVHSSNMSKLDRNGHPIYRDDGKILKGPDYFEPNLEKIIENGTQKY